MSELITIRVTNRDIKEGEGRNCTGCPIATAINRKLTELGFDDDAYVWVEPYGMFWNNPVGIEIRSYFHKPLATLPVGKLPPMVYEWAMNFDDWDDMRSEGWRAYEKRTGEQRPSRPHPFSFTLNLEDFNKHIAE